MATLAKMLACAAVGVALAGQACTPSSADATCSADQDETAMLQALHRKAAGKNTCPGSGTPCSGNQCCPGAEITGGETFPCPDAAPGWNQCQTDTPTPKYAMCKEKVDKKCDGCSGEQCSYCNWDGDLECCKEDKCKGCSGTVCLSCYEDCCKQEGVPEGYCKKDYPTTTTTTLSGYETCKAEVDEKCHGCSGEQCSYCNWDGDLECCKEDKCKGCSGTVCLFCYEDCCKQEGVPESYCKKDYPTTTTTTLSGYETCKAEVDEKCHGCSGEQCSYCNWDGDLECCKEDRCKGCSGTVCLSCYEDCCEQEGVPKGYCKKDYPTVDPNVCPGSGVGCQGNQCCPGAEISGGQTFPCPGAAPGWNQCQTELP